MASRKQIEITNLLVIKTGKPFIQANPVIPTKTIARAKASRKLRKWAQKYLLRNNRTSEPSDNAIRKKKK